MYLFCSISLVSGDVQEDVACKEKLTAASSVTAMAEVDFCKHSVFALSDLRKQGRGENRFVFRAAARENAIQRPAWC